MPRHRLVAGLLLVPAALAAQQPAQQSHTVRPGDTLWSLAQQYLGDPLLWPEIYRLNTAVVEDPHWIYPGEVLRLNASETAQAVPSEDTPPPADAAAADAEVEMAPEPGVLAQGENDLAPAGQLFPTAGRRGSQTAEETIRAYSMQNYRPLRRSEYYAAAFYSEGAALPYGTVAGRVTPPDIQSLTNRDAAKPFTELALVPPDGQAYEVGDTVMFVTVSREAGPYGHLVTPTGLGRVAKYDGKHYIASVTQLFGTVYPGQRVLPLPAFTPAGSNQRAVAVSDGVQAAVTGWPGRRQVQLPQQVLLLDKGSADGVKPGDLFEVRRTPGERRDGTVAIDEPLALLQVVKSGERTASAIILTVRAADIPVGTRARQVAKLPS